MFLDYKKENKYISGVMQQYNIMVFIGNGFDIAVLNKYRKDNLISSYNKFYDYLIYKEFNKKNIIFKKMNKDKKNTDKENWSDFENSLQELINDEYSASDLTTALKEIQNMFLLFLNEIVTADVLLKLNSDAEKNGWARDSLSKFLGDLSEDTYKNIKFPTKTTVYDMYNFLFVNFNFTSLFDNYIFLDKEQFEPHPHKTVDTNFLFYPNPNSYKCNKWNYKTAWSSFVMTNIIHPHGYQNIPRSLLFGIESETANSEINRFNKSYWAQNNQKYGKYFENVNLFIIYGSSMGKTDSWWWKNIYNSIKTKKSELIIYYYSKKNYDSDHIKDLFIKACEMNASKEEINDVKKQIYVVLYYNNNKNKMFSLNCI